MDLSSRGDVPETGGGAFTDTRPGRPLKGLHGRACVPGFTRSENHANREMRIGQQQSTLACPENLVTGESETN